MKDKASVSDRTVAELIERVGRAAFGDGFTAGLNPAQWAALRYFGRANRFSRTVGGFAQFHGTTQGTASQTVKSLVEKNYLTRTAVPTDRRSFLLKITTDGQALLAGDPINELTKAVRELPPSQLPNLSESLDKILVQMLTRRGQPRFGVCSCCCHLRLDACRGHAQGPHECGLLGEPLSQQETTEICANYADARLQAT